MVTGKRSRSYSVAGKPAKRRRLRASGVARRQRRFLRGKRQRIPKIRQLPTRFLTKMTYCQKLTLSTPIGAYSIYRFQSSIFDPDLTGTGHQPYYHDQWATMYSKYKVHGFRYRIQFVNTGSYPAWVAVLHCPHDSYSGSSIETEMEKPANRKRMLLGSANSSSAKRTVSGYVSVRKLEGLGKAEFAGHEAYEAAFGANPSRVVKLAIEYEGMSATSDIYALVHLTYYTEIYNRTEVVGS